MEFYTKVKVLIILFIIMFPIMRYIYNFYIKKSNTYDVYVINMKKDKKRLKKITEQLNESGIKFKKVLGVDGQTLHKDILKKNKMIKEKTPDDFTLPKIGCSLSHKKTWIHAYKHGNKYNDILVIDDNAILRPGFKEKLNDLVYELRGVKYDICYLGRKPLVKDNKKHEKSLSNNVEKALKSEMGGGYIINRNSLVRVLDNYKIIDDKPDKMFHSGKLEVVSSKDNILYK